MMLRPRALAVSVAVAACLCGAASCGRTNDSDVELMSVAKARRLWVADRGKATPATLFVDSRSTEDYAGGHIPGAGRVSLSDLVQDRVAPIGLRSSGKIVVYGADPGSPAAMGLAKRLQSMGYDSVYLMQGGLLSWRTNGGEVEK